MERTLVSLGALTLGCIFAAALFGFGAQVYAWRSVYEGDLGREQVILLTRLLVFLVLAVILILRSYATRVGALPARLRLGRH